MDRLWRKKYRLKRPRAWPVNEPEGISKKRSSCDTWSLNEEKSSYSLKSLPREIYMQKLKQRESCSWLGDGIGDPPHAREGGSVTDGSRSTMSGLSSRGSAEHAVASGVRESKPLAVNVVSGPHPPEPIAGEKRVLDISGSKMEEGVYDPLLYIPPKHESYDERGKF